MSEYLGNLQYSSTGYGVGSGSACLALHWDTLGFTRAKLPICAAFCSGSGLRTCNSQTCGTCFRISDLRYQVQILRLTNYSHWDSCWRLFMGGKICVFSKFNGHSNQVFPGTGDHSSVEPLPFSMFIRSEGSYQMGDAESGADIKIREQYLVCKSIINSEEDSLDWRDSPNSIVIVVINSYSCFLIELMCQTKTFLQFERLNRLSNVCMKLADCKYIKIQYWDQKCDISDIFWNCFNHSI